MDTTTTTTPSTEIATIQQSLESVSIAKADLEPTKITTTTTTTEVLTTDDSSSPALVAGQDRAENGTTTRTTATTTEIGKTETEGSVAQEADAPLRLEAEKLEDVARHETEEETTKVPSRTFTMAEVAAHNKPNDLWLVVEGDVYDVSEFKSSHPGGDRLLISVAGKDATKKFLRYHRIYLLGRYKNSLMVGKIEEDETSASVRLPEKKADNGGGFGSKLTNWRRLR